MSVKHTSAQSDQNDTYKAAMEDVEEQHKAQTAVLDSMQHAASDAQAPILEQQEANIRDGLRCVHREHLSV